MHSNKQNLHILHIILHNLHKIYYIGKVFNDGLNKKDNAEKVGILQRLKNIEDNLVMIIMIMVIEKWGFFK